MLCCVDVTSASPVSPWCHLPSAQGNKDACFPSVPRTNSAMKVNMLDILCLTGLEQHRLQRHVGPPLQMAPANNLFSLHRVDTSFTRSGCALMQHHKGWAPPCRILEAQREGRGAWYRQDQSQIYFSPTDYRFCLCMYVYA